MKNLYAIALFLLAFPLIAQNAGTLDNNFGTSGSVTTFSALEYYPRSIVSEDYTGNIYAAGQYKNGANTVGVVNKLDFYGNPITSFGVNGAIIVNNHSATYQNLIKISTTGSEGKFLAQGYYRDLSNVIRFYISAFDSSGAVDTSFGVNGSLPINKGTTFELFNGNIYVLTTNSNSKPIIRKFTLSGIEDLTYNFVPSTSSSTISDIDLIIENNGSVLISGNIQLTPNVNRDYIEKHLPTGATDLSFGINGAYIGVVNYAIERMNLQKIGVNAGKIVFINKTLVPDSLTPIVTRLNANGTLDSSFGSGGSFSYAFPFTGNWLDEIEVDSVDNIILCGSKGGASNQSEMSVMGLTSNGAFQYLTANDNSVYSENWTMSKVPNSFLLTFCETWSGFATDTHTCKVKRYFLKPAVISLIGSAMPNGGNTEIDLSTTDNENYFTNNLNLTPGAIKFRLDNNWLVNWGAGISNPFPTATATMGKNDIIVPDAGIYNITFNIKTGVYNFQNNLSVNEFNNIKLSITPNPANSIINIESEAFILSLKIIDIAGRITLPIFSNNKIDVSNLASGVYFLEAKTNNGVVTKKFIKS